MKTVKWLSFPRRKGVALIAVISALALATVLLLAMFSVTDTEFKATRGYVSAQSAKQFADISVAVVQAQIQNGQYNPLTDTTRTTHATQPGCVQVFSASSANAGQFVKGFKLYSSSKMMETTQAALVADAAPANWDTAENSARYVDLNQPVVRSATSGSSAKQAIYFPVIDPRAAANTLPNSKAPGTTAVEGFSYSNKTDLMGPAASAVDYSTSTLSPVIVPPSAFGVDADTMNKLRLPMPVEWIYLLKDGTMGTLDAQNKFITPAGGTAATTDNPIVGRMAFWTDDESCKINVNTASEPTFMGTPFYYHERDRRWAHYPAASDEYQRYPGHPATVALSSVLCPGYRLDQYNPDKGLTTENIRDLKDQIYALAPKIAGGDVANDTYAGSEAGTLPFIVDDFAGTWGDTTGPKGQGKHIDLSSAKSERLYASVDEMLFKESGFNTAKGRQANEFPMPGDPTRKLFDHDTLERTRFFLTAKSRSPEFSIHGFPRICMWPVADESWPNTYQSGGGVANVGRTSFDNAIALCSTINNTKGGTTNGKGSYFFRRLDAYHPSTDVLLSRNSTLLNYLTNELTVLSYPKTGLATANTLTFDDKYGADNVNQIAIEIFDYVRCINLYDGVLARYNDGTSVAGAWTTATSTPVAPKTATDNWGAYYKAVATTNATRYTFTAKRQTAAGAAGKGTTAGEQTDKLGVESGDSDSNVLPGHGVVTPAVWTKGASSYKGFGRSFTLSEVGLHFICTADGGDREAPPNAAADQGSPNLGYLTTKWQVGVGAGPGFKTPFPKLSGGGTAYRADPTVYLKGNGNPNAPMTPLNNSDVYGGLNVPDANARWWSNFPPVKDLFPPQSLLDAYGCDASKAANKVTNPAHPSYHPGFKPENWNTTLDWNTPLTAPDPTTGKGGEKRVQCSFDFEGFCPSLGWTKFFPEFTIKINGDWLAQFKIKNSTGNPVPLFSTTGPIFLKSNSNIYEANNVYALGGHAGPAAFSGGRGMRGTGSMGSDYNYDSNSGAGTSGIQNQLTNYGVTSDFITIARDKAMEVTFPNDPMVIEIYDSHDVSTAHLVQTINISLPAQTSLPTPLLVSPVGSVINAQTWYSNGGYSYNRSLQGPHWWVFNIEGAVGRVGNGEVNPNWTTGKLPFWTTLPKAKTYATDILQVTRGRFDTSGGPPGITGAPNKFDAPQGASYSQTINTQPDSTSDVVRTMIPAIGDYRVLAALTVVPASMWKPHPVWAAQMSKPALSQLRTIHGYTDLLGNTQAGGMLAVDPTTGSVDLTTGITTFPTAKPEYEMPSKAYEDGTATAQADGSLPVAHSDRIPDVPGDSDWLKAANSFGDFDTGISRARQGPYINKPDEGNYYAVREARTFNSVSTGSKLYRSGYFFNSWRQTDDWRNGIYMTPNRLVASPVMFGSLPTGVYGGSKVPATASALGTLTLGTGKNAARPWQTLLFRPHSVLNPGGSVIASKAQHPGQFNPMDHYLLDLFFMPVVEPYAISEPLSVAGRVNMNYQILPFTNIRRATALHAVMKGEFMTAIPKLQGAAAGEPMAKYFKKEGLKANLWDTFYNEKAQAQGDTSDNIFWHRPINVDRTLDQFDERFKLDYAPTGTGLGVFRSASQICEMHLIPSPGQNEAAPGWLTALQNKQQMAGSNRQLKMNAFWEANPATGDNVRERPYSNLYARLTTRSNTFRVHMRTQVLQKARSTDPDKVDPIKDAVISEYRGSTVIERYIDPTDTSLQLPDYAASSNLMTEAPLDTFYRFRTIESKRFNP